MTSAARRAVSSRRQHCGSFVIMSLALIGRLLRGSSTCAVSHGAVTCPIEITRKPLVRECDRPVLQGKTHATERRRSLPATLLPHRRLLGPARVLISLGKRLARLFQGCVVVRLLVSSDACPVESLWRGVCLGKLFDDVAKALLRLVPFLVREGNFRCAEHELGEKVLGGEESFGAMALHSVRIQLEDGRSPWRLVQLAVLFEKLRIRL